MGKLTSLLKWRKPLVLKDKDGKILKDDDGNPVMVYVRVIGDYDLEQASRKARYASALRRVALLDSGSEDYVINVGLLDDADEEQCREVIRQGRSTNWSAEAYSTVVVPDLPKLEEIARDPDAPTLEELERLDQAIDTSNKEYRQKLDEYMKTRDSELQAELADKSPEDLKSLAKESMIVLLSIEAYLSTLRDEKVWRSVYQDDKYTLPEFSNLEEFLQTDSVIRDQIYEAYEALEQGLNDVKN